MTLPKTVLITGCSSGIGKATAKLFAHNGWNVIATMRNPEKETDLTQISNIKLLKLDVTNGESIKTCLAEAFKLFPKIDVLINNAGFGVMGAFEASSAQDIRQQFDTNVLGLMEMTRAILPHFKQNKTGIIINISSMGGKITLPLYSTYHSTKFAVEGFTESLQYELRPFGIKLKLIEPGAINTPFYSSSAHVADAHKFPEYENYQTKILNSFNRAGANGATPEKVAKVIWRAALSKSSKLRYAVGSPAPMILFARKLLPDWIFFKLVRVSAE